MTDQIANTNATPEHFCIT